MDELEWMDACNWLCFWPLTADALQLLQLHVTRLHEVHGMATPALVNAHLPGTI
jgi:hypothetical protein